jgi:hypothetical protein
MMSIPTRGLKVVSRLPAVWLFGGAERLSVRALGNGGAVLDVVDEERPDFFETLRDVDEATIGGGDGCGGGDDEEEAGRDEAPNGCGA